MDDEGFIQIAYKAWFLGTEDAMFKALKDSRALGYRGQVRVWDAEGGGDQWDLEINPPADGPPVLAYMGEYLVRIGTSPIEKLTPEQFAAKGYGAATA